MAGFLVDSFIKTTRFNEDLTDVQTCNTENTLENIKNANQAIKTEEQNLTASMTGTEPSEVATRYHRYEQNLELPSQISLFELTL